ncbi:MAG: ArsA family ATPase [Actinomycetota bacterium]|nr:ArsA family ATPase [Actinomycetota bacterium]
MTRPPRPTTRMHTDEFLEPKILIVSGKGGVGKTTVSAALALVAARHGRKVCIAEVDRKGTLPKLFGGRELTYDPTELLPDVWGLNIVPEESLAEYLRVQYHMRRISKVFTSTHFVDYITTAAPGLKDILVLGKIWYLEQNRSGASPQDFDTIVVDAPAAGHMLTFFSAPTGLADAVRVGPIRRQSEWLVDMLRDPKRTRVHLVTLAEEMPVSETLETSDALVNKLGMSQGAVFANSVYSPLFTQEEEGQLDELDGSRRFENMLIESRGVGLSIDGDDLRGLIRYARFLTARRRIQEQHLKQLRRGAGQPVVNLPFLFSAGLALPDIETLADVIEEKVEDL